MIFGMHPGQCPGRIPEYGEPRQFGITFPRDRFEAVLFCR